MSPSPALFVPSEGWATGSGVLERLHKLLLALPVACSLPDWAQPSRSVQCAAPPARFGEFDRPAVPDLTLPYRWQLPRFSDLVLIIPPATHIAGQIRRIDVRQQTRLGAGDHKHGAPDSCAPSAQPVPRGTERP